MARHSSSEPSPGEAGGGTRDAFVVAMGGGEDAASPSPASPREGARRRLRSSILAFSLLLLSACGFRPLYGSGGGGLPNVAVQAMAETRIALIANRPGQELRNNLLDRLTPRGQPAKPRYELIVTLDERFDRLGIARDDAATYGRLSLTASFTLRELDSGQPVLGGQSRWMGGFTVVVSHFANLNSEAGARSRGLREIGDDIRQQIVLHFTKSAS